MNPVKQYKPTKQIVEELLNIAKKKFPDSYIYPSKGDYKNSADGYQFTESKVRYYLCFNIGESTKAVHLDKDIICQKL